MFVSITLDGTPKEIAALVAELQKQHSDKPRTLSPQALANKISRHLRDRVESGPIV